MKVRKHYINQEEAEIFLGLGSHDEYFLLYIELLLIPPPSNKAQRKHNFADFVMAVICRSKKREKKSKRKSQNCLNEPQNVYSHT